MWRDRIAQLRAGAWEHLRSAAEPEDDDEEPDWLYDDPGSDELRDVEPEEPIDSVAVLKKALQDKDAQLARKDQQFAEKDQRIAELTDEVSVERATVAQMKEQKVCRSCYGRMFG